MQLKVIIVGKQKLTLINNNNNCIKILYTQKIGFNEFLHFQIKNDSYLEDLNNILNNGDVPNIYQADELDKIYQLMRGAVQEAGLQINKSNLFSAYVKIVRSNLHTVIAMRFIDFYFVSSTQFFRYKSSEGYIVF